MPAGFNSRVSSPVGFPTIETSVVNMIKNRQNQTSNIVRKYQNAKFLICNSCFWCASSISSDYNYTERCPTCRSTKIESVPISETEAYQISIDTNSVSMEFWNV
jgi:hypothetical protein